MILKIKFIVASILWSVSVAAALADSVWGAEEMAVWSVISAAAAAVVTSMIVGDYIAADAAVRISQASVDRMMKAIQKSGQSREDKIVDRVAGINRAAMREVAEEIARAMRNGHSDRPTPIR